MQESFDFVEAALVDGDGGRIEPVALGAGTVHVGTCGFSYKDWIGSVYPPQTKPREMLERYAERFTCVEVDSTYYRMPGVATFASFVRRTPPAFAFSVKLPGSLTHVPADATVAVDDDATLFRERLEPLVAAGKLAAVLAQFPNSFHPSERTRAYLRDLRAALADVPLVVEFRHREWQSAETLHDLDRLGIAWCNVDEPHFSSLLRPSSDVTGPLAYVRFHGRNYARWWRGSSAERYEYRYAAEELLPWTERVADMSGKVRDVYAFFNNHRFGNAARDAQTFARLLLGGGDAPAA